MQAAFAALQTGDAPVVCILEQQLPLAAECSVVLARGHDGQCVHLPLQLNRHRDGILAVTEVWANALPEHTTQQALHAAQQIAASLHYVGVLCVEFFLIEEGPVCDVLGPLVVNEIAPRPHNSGHHSLDACDLSQFELQVRCMARLPLRQVRLHSPVAMINLLGDLWYANAASQARTPPWDRVLALPGVHLHLYGKLQPRRGRKMGHLTITAVDAAALDHVSQQVTQILGLPAATAL